MQGLELQHQREPWRAPQFVLDDVTGDFRRQGEWESHNLNLKIERAL